MRCTMLLSIVVLGACSWMPRQGDLVFQVAGGGDMSQAIVDATTNVDSLQFPRFNNEVQNFRTE